MDSKNLLLFMIIMAAVAWFGLGDKKGPAEKPANLAAPYQAHMDKAKAVQGQLQEAADQRAKRSY